MIAPSSWSLFLVAGVLLSSGVNTVPQDFVFEKDREECLLKNGEKGNCLKINSCPSAMATFTVNPPVICGFSGKIPIVCCANKTDTGTDDGAPHPALDIASPTTNFDCGISSPRIVHLDFGERVKRGGAENTGSEGTAPRLESGLRQNRPSVVGGETAEINAWPWMALLGQRDAMGNISWFCGGVLLNQHWVLTAQHCFRQRKADVVRLGEHDFNSDTDGATPEDYDVAETILYPDYIPLQAYHDLALLKLSREVNIQSDIRPACLPWGQESATNITGQRVMVTGWGNTFYGGPPSSTLQEVTLTLFPSSRCDQSYSKLLDYPFTWPRGIQQETACAGDPSGGKDACQGDSGGPLLYQSSTGRYTLVGTVSQGYGCAHKDYPGLYVNIRNPQYLAWIKKVAF